MNKYIIITAVAVLMLVMGLLFIEKANPQEPVGNPSSEPSFLEQEAKPAIDATKKALSEQLSYDVRQILLKEIKAATWSDACLGLPRPKELCAQTLTSGYEITLSADGNQYIYRANKDGSVIRFAA